MSHSTLCFVVKIILTILGLLHFYITLDFVSYSFWKAYYSFDRHCFGFIDLFGENGDKRCGFHPWVGRIPWRRKWQPTQVFLPEESMDRGAWRTTVHVGAKSDSTEITSHGHLNGIEFSTLWTWCFFLLFRYPFIFLSDVS